MPFDLADLISKNPAIVPPPNIQATSTPAPSNKPDFLFAKSGNVWEIRFRSVDTIEQGRFNDELGFQYYCKLFQFGNKGITALELSPPGNSSGNVSRPSSAIDEDEAFNGVNDDGGAFGFSEEGTSYQEVRGSDLIDLARQVEYLVEMIAALGTTAADKETKTELKRQMREAKQALKTRRFEDSSLRPANDAVNRVKGCLRRVRTKLRVSGMNHVARFLEAQVKPVHFGWRYLNDPPVQWFFTVPD